MTSNDFFSIINLVAGFVRDFVAIIFNFPIYDNFKLGYVIIGLFLTFGVLRVLLIKGGAKND